MHVNMVKKHLKSVPRTLNSEIIISSTKTVRKTRQLHAEKWNWNPILHSQKINWNWLKDLNIRPKTIKLLEENIGGKLTDISLGNNFLNLTPKAKTTKEKNKQVGLHQTKKLLHSKGNHQQNEKATYLTGGNICKSHIW